MIAHGTFEHQHSQWEDKYSNSPEFLAEEMAIDVTDEALEILSARNLTRSRLAETMGVSRQRVSTIFNATPNLTLLSIAQIGVALNVKPRVILDSKRYFIQSTNEAPLDYEDYMITMASNQSYVGTSATDTVVQNPVGVANNASA